MTTSFNTPGDCRVRFFTGGCSMQRVLHPPIGGSAMVREIIVCADTRVGGCMERNITSLDFMEPVDSKWVAWTPMPLSQFLQVEGMWDDSFFDVQKRTPKPAQ